MIHDPNTMSSIPRTTNRVVKYRDSNASCSGSKSDGIRKTTASGAKIDVRVEANHVAAAGEKRSAHVQWPATFRWVRR